MKREIAMGFSKHDKKIPPHLSAFADHGDFRPVLQDLRHNSCDYFRQLSEATFEAIFLSDKGVCLGQNRSAREIFGYTDEEAIGRMGTEWIHPGDRDTVMANMLADIEEPYEVTALRKDGSTFPCEIQARVEQYKGHTIRITALRDITLRRQTEKKFLSEAKRRAILMANSGDGIAILNKDFRVIEANQRFAEMLGYDLDEVQTLHLWDFEEKFNKEEIRKNFRVTASLDGFKETLHRRKDGSVYHAEVRANGAMIEGEPLFIAITRDITERKEVEEELLRTKKAAERASQYKSEFLANMSHEIRTPLNGIMGMLRLMQSATLTEEVEDYVHNALQASERLSHLLGDILDLSQVEAGRMKIQPSTFLLREALETVEKIFSPSFQEKGLSLLFDIAPDIPKAFVGDCARLQQLLCNFISNALKFTRTGSVSVGVWPVGQADSGKVRILFTVSDTGIGIADDKLPSLFDAFIQGETSYARSYQGAGLGLFISKQLLSLLGGNMAVSSREGAGTSVYFTIPFAPAVQSEIIPEIDGSRSKAGHSLRILLAEDDRINRLVMSGLLKKLGHQVNMVENGEEVLAALRYRNDPYDVLLMDIQMPVLDGVEVTRIIRNHTDFKAHAGTPIIAMTAYAMRGDEEKFLESGMNGYISKPVAPEKLQEVLEQVICRQQDQK